MRKLIPWLLLFALVVLAGCVAGPNDYVGTQARNFEKLPGFWLGLWHGLISFFTLIVSLVTDDVSVYEVHNKGGLYDLGFILGVMMAFGGGGSASSRSR